MSHYSPDNSKDFFDLLNFPESPDHMVTVPLPGEQALEENSFTPSASFPLTSMRCFQKDLLKLMMEGIKISLVSSTKHIEGF